MDLQGQAAQLRQRQLRRRPAAGQRPVQLQRRDLPRRHPDQGLQGTMSRRLRISLLLAALVALVAAASAYAIRAEIGKTVVSATAVMQPRDLPAHGGAPVTLTTTTRIGTKDGSMPPALKTLTFELDKNGFIETKGLPTCTLAKLEGTTPR